MAHEWVYYSVPHEGSKEVCVIDFTNEDWHSPKENMHLIYRTIFPGSVIHCIPITALGSKRHTGIRYHMGER